MNKENLQLHITEILEENSRLIVSENDKKRINIQYQTVRTKKGEPLLHIRDSSSPDSHERTYKASYDIPEERPLWWGIKNTPKAFLLDSQLRNDAYRAIVGSAIEKILSLKQYPLVDFSIFKLGNANREKFISDPLSWLLAGKPGKVNQLEVTVQTLADRTSDIYSNVISSIPSELKEKILSTSDCYLIHLEGGFKYRDNPQEFSRTREILCSLLDLKHEPGKFCWLIKALDSETEKKLEDALELYLKRILAAQIQSQSLANPVPGSYGSNQ